MTGGHRTATRCGRHCISRLRSDLLREVASAAGGARRPHLQGSTTQGADRT